MPHLPLASISDYGLAFSPNTELIVLAPVGEALEDPRQAVQIALAHPQHFPPLAEAVAPGDTLVIAMERGVPQGPAIVAAILDCLRTSVQALDITLLVATTAEAEEYKDLPGLQTLVHDAADRENLSYLAASQDARPIYLNRLLCDADFVIPISCTRPAGSLACWGPHGGLFPTFADEATKKRFRAPVAAESAVHHRLRRQEADETAWLLGVQFAINVVPGPGDSLLGVFAGEAAAIAAAAGNCFQSAWHGETEAPCELVVATIEGKASQQTWENLAQALDVATRVADEGGAIVLCTRIEEAPGPALASLAEDESASELRRLRSPDATAAFLINEARRNYRLYLMSGLPAPFVESIGMGVVETAADIERLSRTAPRCLLIPWAQYSWPSVRNR